MMILKIFLGACLLVYLLSMVELIGSWILTDKKQHVQWNLTLSIFIPMFVPFIAPIAAGDCIYSAKSLYDRKKPNKHHYQESLYEWLRHDRLSIDEWANKNYRL